MLAITRANHTAPVILQTAFRQHTCAGDSGDHSGISRVPNVCVEPIGDHSSLPVNPRVRQAPYSRVRGWRGAKESHPEAISSSPARANSKEGPPARISSPPEDGDENSTEYPGARRGRPKCRAHMASPETVERMQDEPVDRNGQVHKQNKQGKIAEQSHLHRILRKPGAYGKALFGIDAAPVSLDHAFRTKSSSSFWGRARCRRKSRGKKSNTSSSIR